MSFSVAKAQDTAMTVSQYINRFKDIAIREMKATGIPASITLAQGIIESANGSSYLARYARNHFGIKCKGDWKGKTVKYNDDAPDECFRAYDKAEDSYLDHSNYLKNTKRYAFLFQLQRTDYKGWANGLKQAGYASNPSYPQLLINTIESLNLQQYDILPGDSVTKDYGKPLIYNKISAYKTKQNETYRQIAGDNRMMGWQIYHYNDLRSRYLDVDIPVQPIPGTILYLMPKKRSGNEPFHVMQPGESMYAVSQQYGIKLKRLYKKNLLEKGERMQPGDTVYLQTKRKNPPSVLSKVDINKTLAPSKNKLPEASQAGDLSNTALAKQGGIIVFQPGDINADSAMNHGFYIVQEGESLFGISQKFNRSIDQIKIYNHMLSDRVYKGQKLYIPPGQKDTLDIPPKNLYAAPVLKPDTAASIAPKSVLNPVPQAIDTSQLVADAFHIVQKGETLFSIAKKYHLTVANLKAINHMKDDKISAGEKLILKPE